MKYTVAIFAAIAAVANGQAQCESAAEGIPPCALGYIASAASANFGCGLLDFACQCSNSQALQVSLAQPLLSACPDGIGGVLSAVGNVCSCVASNSGAAPLTATPAECITQAAAIPPCALGYLASAGKAIGQCSLQDFACQCSNSQAIQGSIAQNVISACGNDGLNAVLGSAGALCSCAGGSGPGSASGSGSGSASASATGSGSSKATGSSSAAATGGSSGAPKATSSAKTGGTGPATFTGAAAPAAIGGGVLAFVGGLVAML